MSVSDKTSDGQYIDKISDALKGGKDKFEIGKYLQNQGGFNILEIGPGGGQALEKAIIVSEGWHRTDKYFVIDLDTNILNRLKDNPVISNWEDYNLIKANAMILPFKDESYDMINLSAVAHECSSYGGGFSGFNELAKESSRVLKKNGVLVFRDLEGVNLIENNKCLLDNIPSKAFFKMFFKRFMDVKFSTLNKPSFYDLRKIRITLDDETYDLNSYFTKANFQQSHLKITIEGPVGIIREIQRHFITFLDAYVPEYYYEVAKSFDDNDDIILRFQKNSSTRGFLDFCDKSNVNCFKISKFVYQINKSDKKLFDSHIDHKFNKLLDLHLIKVPEKKVKKLINILADEKINISKKQDTFLMPLGEILYLDNVLKNINAEILVDEAILNWSRREGEEFYFFGDFASILIGFVENSIRLEQTPGGAFSGLMVLAPVDSKFIPRKKYASVIECHFQSTEDGFDCGCLEGKRIIHFQKLPVESGFNKIIDFFYNDIEFEVNNRIKKLLGDIEKHIRDYVSRSLEFNRNFKEILYSDPFIRDILIIDDEVENIGSSKEIAAIEGANLVLVGRIATKKEPFRIYFKNRGYEVINLTDILSNEIGVGKPTRRDLFFAGKKLKRKHGPAILAKKAVKKIKSEKIDKFMILGCRSPIEIQYIKENISNVLVMGLFPDSDKLLSQLKTKYPDVDSGSFYKWIEWNDGKESDGYTNIKMCMQMCDLLISGLEKQVMHKE